MQRRISKMSEIVNVKSFRQNARNCAIRELLYHLDPCRSEGGGCWFWPKYRDKKGYGVIFFDGFKFPVHRLSFQHFKGMIPQKMLIMHECDNPPCWNPDHLFLGDHQDNMDDMVRKGRSGKEPKGMKRKVDVTPELRKRLEQLADEKAMEPIKEALDEVLAQKRRLYDEMERRKLLSRDKTRLVG